MDIIVSSFGQVSAKTSKDNNNMDNATEKSSQSTTKQTYLFDMSSS